MTRIAYFFATCLLLLVCGTVFGQSDLRARISPSPADTSSKQVLDTYAYPQMVAAKLESDSNVDGASEEDEDKKYSKYRMRQLDIKERAVFMLCVVAILAHWIVMGSLRRTRFDATQQLVTATGLIYVIFGTILLVLLALTDQQLTAATGILGAIAGYLFGSSPRGESAATSRGGSAGGTSASSADPGTGGAAGGKSENKIRDGDIGQSGTT